MSQIKLKGGREMYLLTVAVVQAEFSLCRGMAQKGSEEREETIRKLLPEVLKEDESIRGRMIHAVNLREIDLLLGRNFDDELSFIIPKRLLDEETERELHRGGWDTGHWFRNMATDELMVEVSTSGTNHH